MRMVVVDVVMVGGLRLWDRFVRGAGDVRLLAQQTRVFAAL